MPRMGRNKPAFEISEKTARVIAALDTMKPGDVIAWHSLSKIIGENAQEEGRHYVQQARKVMRRDKRRVYECIRGVGVKYLTQPEVGRYGVHPIRKVHRAAKVGADKLECLHSTDGMTPHEVATHRAHLSMLGLLSSQSSYHKRQEVEKRSANSMLPPTPDMESLKGF